MAKSSVTLETPVELRREPLVTNNRSLAWITDKVSTIVEAPTPKWWLISFLITSPIALMGLCCIVYQISNGVGVWGENHPNGWAWDITNFVFWIGIGHAGTLISAILFLTRQKWRTSINRAAEAMTLFAVMCAGIFPAIHVGRFWNAYFLAPIPNANGIWPNFRSPLLWDVFAVSTYFSVSVLFWFVGLIPDLATLRDRAKSRIARFLYGVFALGWRGSNRHWRHYEMAYLLLAGLSTPLVLSVHSIVSFDFATSILPGWHHLPALLRCGRDFRRIRDGSNHHAPSRQDLPANQRSHHTPARGQNGEDHPADWLDSGVRLPDGAFCCVVQRQ
jgi:molybdopterin-containing oxidoreductase family membrane subunit